MKRQGGCDGEDNASLSDLDTVGSRDSLEDDGWLFLLGHNMLKKKVTQVDIQTWLICYKKKFLNDKKIRRNVFVNW